MIADVKNKVRCSVTLTSLKSRLSILTIYSPCHVAFISILIKTSELHKKVTLLLCVAYNGKLICPNFHGFSDVVETQTGKTF